VVIGLKVKNRDQQVFGGSEPSNCEKEEVGVAWWRGKIRDSNRGTQGRVKIKGVLVYTLGVRRGLGLENTLYLFLHYLAVKYLELSAWGRGRWES